MFTGQGSALIRVNVILETPHPPLSKLRLSARLSSGWAQIVSQSGGGVVVSAAVVVSATVVSTTGSSVVVTGIIAGAGVVRDGALQLTRCGQLQTTPLKT